MKITILTSSYPRFPGDGTAPFIQSIAQSFINLGHEVEVAVPYDPQVVETVSSRIKIHRYRYIWPKRLHIMGHAKALEADVRLRSLAFILLPFFLIAAFFKLLRVTREQKSQIIHAHWVLPNGPVAVLVAWVRKIPFVVSLHGSDMYIAQKNPLFKAVTRWVFSHAAAVTSCSKQLLKAAQSLDAPSASYIFPWGVDSEKFYPKPKNPELALSWGLHPDDIHIIALGRLVHKKGFEVLLRAFAKLAHQHSQVKLVIGGEGSLRSTLAAAAQKYGIQDQVVFPGRISWDQVVDFFAQGDIFVLPSIQDIHGNVDGLPTVLVEALACGLPVIASDIGGVQMLIEDGENGLLIHPGDSQALGKALKRLLSNEEERYRLGQNAHQSVINDHLWDSVAGKLIEIFHAAIQ